ncbi:FG-GAP-like repeat-containing protein [Halalkalibaculum sp. DA3122]|uniref:FG-GAP-like repeat-containing protein n=1 Tax=Halalkalibaculum sp. DA3122 TaxID=3373607 RepID=UPI003754947A
MAKKNQILLIFFCLLAGCSPEPKELKWVEKEGYRWAEVHPKESGKVGFIKRDNWDTNIDFINNLSQADIDENQNYMNGSGVATADVDGDGWTDVYFGNLKGENKLYKNSGGFRFNDITEHAGVGHDDFHTTGVVFADVDGDDDPDLLVASLDKKNALYINDGTGQFHLKEDSGLNTSKGSTTMTLADIDDDKDLDLFVANNKEKPARNIFKPSQLKTTNMVELESKGQYRLRKPFDKHYTILYREHKDPLLKERAEVNELYINNGSGEFDNVKNISERFLDSDGNPADLKPEWSLTAKFYDINGNGLPDLYVCNDFWTTDRIWINIGKGRFKAASYKEFRNFSFSSMGVAIADIDRDGTSDIFVSEMLSKYHHRRARQIISMEPYPSKIQSSMYQPQYMRNSLYLNRGDNTFAEISHYSGVEATGWSWATQFLDVDLDGYEDLIVNTGHVYDAMDIDYQKRRGNQIDRSKGRIQSYVKLDQAPPLNLRNKIYRNRNDLTFEEVGKKWGFNELDASYGLATADFDNDGDLDLAINRLMDRAVLYENTTASPRIAVKLKGSYPNTRGIGAKVILEGGGIEKQMKEMVSGGNYMSDSSPILTFAANNKNQNHILKVVWPDGKRSIIDSVAANRIYEISKTSSSSKVEWGKTLKKDENIHFKDSSRLINHRHQESHFDDFESQSLLPIQLSQSGPGVSWIDINSDGNDDLIIGAGKDEKLNIFINEDGHLNKIKESKLSESFSGDQTSIVGWQENNNTYLTVGNSNYEQKGKYVSPAYIYKIQNGQVVKKDSLPGMTSSIGPIALSDYDNDGDLDLFLGGRFIPFNYPLDASSKLFENVNGTFKIDQENSKKLRRIGLVTGAVFTDYNEDGYEDLLLSTEWGSLKLFQNLKGSFQNATSSMGLDKYKGWWNAVSTGDFDGNGLPDFVATNIGLNTPYQLESKYPIKLFYDDFNKDGNIDIVEAYYDSTMQSYVPRRQLNKYKSLRGTIMESNLKTHRDFANATLSVILNRNLDSIPSKKINTLRHMIFLNEGTHFNARSLPEYAQLAPAQHTSIADFNNDGIEDIFLSQNLFAVHPVTPRMDAGRGLILKGKGNGNFEPIPGHKSGIKIYGEQKAAALNDINNDGKVDLLVSQNQDSTKVYLNQTKKKGIKVHLNGPLQNRMGIGSSVRLVYANNTKGPIREIQAGSGYWSQRSSKHILGIKENAHPISIEVNWYDGNTQYIKINKSKWKYNISHPDISM